MKKGIMFGMTLLFASAAFVSCSKKSDIFEENKAQLVENQKDEYRKYFVARYGEVPADQNWDFTQVATTRGALGVVLDDLKDPKHFQKNVTKEKTQLKSAISDAGVKTWDPFVSVCMYPVYCWNESLKNQNLNMIVTSGNASETIFTVQMKNDAWWGNKGATGPSNAGKAISTLALYDLFSNNVTWTLSNSNGGTKTIENYKEVIVNGRTYWCFEYNGNNDYCDLIYVVSDNPAPIAKRYLIEDLGAKDDFDFNDIVVDVIQDDAGKQKAIIRAMGGTIDFTLKIGNTSWSKVGAGFDETTMYNTSDFDPTLVLAEFPVEGWNPATNNITATVKSTVSDGVIIEIPFPKTGEIPMIIAIKPIWDWQDERISLPQSWWE